MVESVPLIPLKSIAVTVSPSYLLKAALESPPAAACSEGDCARASGASRVKTSARLHHNHVIDVLKS